MIYLIALATAISTYLGGSFAIRLKDKLHLILGFSAGAVVGVALFDLLPESFTLVSGTKTFSQVAFLIAIGFLAYLVIDRFFSLRVCETGECGNPSHRGIVGASTLSFHSLLDGIGIGLAFQASPAVGWIVTLAVLTHDFSDGINTVNMILKNGGQKSEAFRWLALDALAPAIGIVATMFFTVSAPVLGMILALFTGFFLYLGASDLIPESHHHHPTVWTTLSSILGMILIYLVIQFAG